MLGVYREDEEFREGSIKSGHISAESSRTTEYALKLFHEPVGRSSLPRNGY